MDRRVDLQPGRFRCNTAFKTRLDVKTAFDAANPSAESKILALTGARTFDNGFFGRDARCSWVREVKSKNCEIDFWCSRCIRQRGVEAPVLWGRIAKYVLWTAEEKWRAKGWGLSFGGLHDNEYTLRGMMWADNYWLFCDNRLILICMVGDFRIWSPSRNWCGGQACFT